MSVFVVQRNITFFLITLKTVKSKAKKQLNEKKNKRPDQDVLNNQGATSL